jgi:Protein of unknown function (DUF1553)/Protein of unknown function (DUF1549)/Planctomycete cytochrome C
VIEFRMLRLMTPLRLLLLSVMIVLLRPETAPAEETPEKTFSAKDLTFFEQRIRPLLVEKCLKCHGTGEVEGGLSLASRNNILQGGDSGPAIDLQDPSASLLLEAINYESYEMPPTGKLPQEQIDLLTQWVKLQAPMPTGSLVSDDAGAHAPPQVSAETRSHWSFQQVERPGIPDSGDPEWQRWIANPIDAFVIEELGEAELSPAPPADRRTLVRRLYYDLLGLPPTPEQVEAFVVDDSPDAYERLVENLLDSPQYGEHWARYWLDLVRYAETNSFERDGAKPFVWRYRDYVIRSLNEDKPYDQFVREQLAGDELDEVTPESIIATGYYRLGIWDDEPADPKLAFFDGLDDIAGTTSQALLGLTINCARCHDHKLDPISHADYHRFIAFFRNIRHYGVRAEATVFAASVRKVDLPWEREQNAAAVADWERQISELKSRMESIEQKAAAHLKGGEKDDFTYESARYDILRRRAGEIIGVSEFATYQRLRETREALERDPPPGMSQVLAIREQGTDPPPTHILLRGNPHAEGDEVQPGFPAVLSPPEPIIQIPEHGQSSGRRRALADWIASPQNPLTARVMVNRIWQWHFGRGLVRTPNDFGLQGARPTHPELLDWLAGEFVARGWSIKAMHRLILLSSTYRMASRAGEDATYRGLEIDPTNDLFWRFDMRRLRAEEVRDSILAVNGRLNTSTMFGPSIYPIIPPEVLAGQSRPGEGWHDSPEDERLRRSIYVHIKRSLRVPVLAAFDVAETEFTCPVRFSTTQPTQALITLNSDWMNEEAGHLAGLVRREAAGETAEQVTLALRRVFQRDPDDAEVRRGLELISDLQSEHQLSAEEALHYFCLMALNVNEFLYLD